MTVKRIFFLKTVPFAKKNLTTIYFNYVLVLFNLTVPQLPEDQEGYSRQVQSKSQKLNHEEIQQNMSCCTFWQHEMKYKSKSSGLHEEIKEYM